MVSGLAIITKAIFLALATLHLPAKLNIGEALRGISMMTILV